MLCIMYLSFHYSLNAYDVYKQKSRVIENVYDTTIFLVYVQMNFDFICKDLN